MNGPIIIAVAMPEEAEPLLALATDIASQWTVVGRPAWQLDLGGRDVVVTQTGIGLVNAAVTVTALAGQASPLAVISAGSAGGLGTGVAVGDVVVGTEYLYTQADVSAFGYALGQIPGLPPLFAADETLLPAAGQTVPGFASALLHRGPMISGDAFVTGQHAAAARRDFPAALSCDMESAALAHTCHLLGVPFVSIRGISDLVDAGEAAEHVDDASARSAAVVTALLERV